MRFHVFEYQGQLIGNDELPTKALGWRYVLSRSLHLGVHDDLKDANWSARREATNRKKSFVLSDDQLRRATQEDPKTATP